MPLGDVKASVDQAPTPDSFILLARYREPPIPAALSDVTEALWSVRFDHDVNDWLVLPDGCMDVVLVPDQPPLVAGPATGATALSYEQATCAVGLRFLPGAAASVLGVEADRLRDRVVPLSELGGASWPAELEAAWDAVQHGDAAKARRSLAAAMVGVPRLATPDPSVRRAAELLRHDPNLTIGAIAASMSCSTRTLLRRFERGVGYGPKTFARIMRLQYFLRVQERCPDATLGWLAAYTGFADQAHLSRSCTALAGRPPSALLAQRTSTMTPRRQRWDRDD